MLLNLFLYRVKFIANQKKKKNQNWVIVYLSGQIITPWKQ